MKKFLYLCGIIMLCMDGFSQINGDANWNLTPVFIDDFTTSGRTWDYQFIDQPLKKWHSYYYSSGVTHGNKEHQVFQKRQCRFDSNSGSIKLVSDYVSSTPMTCNDFELPDVYWIDCDDQILHDNKYWLYYYSGAIETNKSFLYGYFEIRCKLPIHCGAFPAFWLFCTHDENDPHYEEIDIFEFSWDIPSLSGNPYFQEISPTRLYTNGSFFANHANGFGESCGRKFLEVPSNTSLDSWNIFGCEWSPNRIVYYLNGETVNEYYSTDSVPFRPMTLIANYAVDNNSVIPINEGNSPSIPISSFFPDTMFVDYIKVNQLNCDCNDHVVLYSNQDVVNYNYSVKKSIVFMPSNSITISSNPKMVFRATDEIVINQGFELQQGQEFELLIHPCPNYSVREEDFEQYKHKIIQTR